MKLSMRWNGFPYFAQLFLLNRAISYVYDGSMLGTKFSGN